MSEQKPEWIKPGAFCVLRDGSKARIYAVDGGEVLPIHGALQSRHAEWIAIGWRETGHYHAAGMECGWDIVGPWIEKPEVYWTKLPAWANWVAMAGRGVWHWFSSKPEICSDGWTAGCSIGQIPSPYAPTFTGYWKDSLVERPK